MSLSRWQLFLARLLLLAYVFFTAIYCLLAYLPFTYQQLIVGELLPWLTRLVKLHPFYFWIALVAGLLTIWTDIKTGPARFLARGFVGMGVLIGIVLMVHPLLTGLTNDVSSLVWCGVSVTPLLWLALIDWLGKGRMLTWNEVGHTEEIRLFSAALCSAIYLCLLYLTVVMVHGWVEHSFTFNAAQWMWSLLWSLVSHLLVFLMVFAVLVFVPTAAGLLPARWGMLAKCLGSWIVVTLLISLVIRYILFPPLSFAGPAASLVAVVLATSLVVFATGTSIRLRRPEESQIESGLDLLITPLRFLDKQGWKKQASALAALAVLAYILSARASRMDWEFLLQKMAVIFVWTVAFAAFYAIAPLSRWSRPMLRYGLAMAVLVTYLGLSALHPRTADESGSITPMGRQLDEFADYDVSFRLVDDMLRAGSGARSGGQGSAFYTFLAENTHIPRSTQLAAVDIHLVDQLLRTSGRRPHIFVFVIDSLRRDYLSPYNAAVNFTPAIAALSQQSAVFENAFTRYGGTGLSEPSIWVGGMMVHKQYITPFAPMNTLQKLIETNGYREWISKDTILQQVVPSSPNTTELDEHIGTMYYDLCQTLDELKGKLAVPESTDNPVFVYTQPQNIHISVIDREGRSVPAGSTFPVGIDAAYASRVQKMDRCLGQFFQALKKNGMFDDSIIVLTSDHGDSLGERGRWGHAYALFPEIVRIPLIIHLPTWLKTQVAYDPQAAAFLTDLAPSLYYLLGQKPVLNRELFGRPLFTSKLEEQKPYLRDAYLLVSSYAPVYGLLSQNGRLLYIADGVNYKDYAYELKPEGSSREAVLTDGQRAEFQKRIREQVNAIARFYGLH